MSSSPLRIARWKSFIWQAWLPVALIALWWCISANSSSPFWPPLSKILSSIGAWAASGELWGDLGFSFGNYAVALVISIILGVGLGIWIGLTKKLAAILDPFLDFLRSLPNVVFVPIIVLVLGIGAWPKIALIAFACVWPILLNTIEGVRQIQPAIFEATRAYRIPLRLNIRRVVLPGALPQIAVGLRIGITVGLVMLVVSEMFGASQGVGFFILDSSQRFKLADTWAGTIVVGVIGWVITAIYGLIEHRLLAWHRQEDLSDLPNAKSPRQAAARSTPQPVAAQTAHVTAPSQGGTK